MRLIQQRPPTARAYGECPSRADSIATGFRSVRIDRVGFGSFWGYVALEVPICLVKTLFDPYNG